MVIKFDSLIFMNNILPCLLVFCGYKIINMTSILECSYIRRRLQEMEEIYPEPHTLDQCDCTSYSYFSLSLILLSVGSYISVLALGDIDGYIFSNLGHMWLVGPIFICSGLMIAVKSVLYLRRKTLIKMLSRQRALLRGFQQLTQQSEHLRSENRNDSTQTLPPAYEMLIDNQALSGGVIPDTAPPSYEEAIFLSTGKVMIISDGKVPSTSLENFEHQAKEGNQTHQSSQETNFLS